MTNHTKSIAAGTLSWYYERTFRTWVVTVEDHNGDQIGEAVYCMKRDLEFTKTRIQE